MRHGYQETVDADGEGEITKEEFVENAMKSGFMKKCWKARFRNMSYKYQFQIQVLE